MALMNSRCNYFMSKDFLTDVATDCDGLSSLLNTLNAQAVSVVAMFSTLMQDSFVQGEVESQRKCFPIIII